MGTSGYEPCGSDAAWDMLSLFTNQAECTLGGLFGVKAPAGRKKRGVTFDVKRYLTAKKLDTWGRWSRLGVVQILSEQWWISISLPVARQCLKDLELVAQDVEFVSGWREPRLFMKHVRDCWGWLAGELARVDGRKAQAGKRNKVKSKAKRPFRRRRLFMAPVAISGPIFGRATRLGAKGRHASGVKKAVMPPELVAALRKTLKVALAAHDERESLRVTGRFAVRGRRRIRRKRRVVGRKVKIRPIKNPA